MFSSLQSKDNLKSYWSELCEVMFVKYVYLAHTWLSKIGGWFYYLLRGQDQMMEIHSEPLKISLSVNTLKETQVTSD